MTEKLQEEIESEQWHGRFLCARWQDEDLSIWMSVLLGYGSGPQHPPT